MSTKKKISIIIISILVLWLIVCVTDFIRVHNFEKPLFCIGTNISDDGCSGHYVGLGYSVDIGGNFMPEDELSGVTKFTYKFFGIHIESGIKD